MAAKVIQALDTPTVCDLAGIAPGTLDYWVRTDLVRPSVRGASGRRVTRLWAIEDVVLVRCLKALREAGCPLQKVREAKAFLESQGLDSLPDQVLFWDGGDIVGVDKWGHLRSLLLRPNQQMLHVLAIPIGQWRSEVASSARPLSIEQTRSPRSRSKRTPARSLAS